MSLTLGFVWHTTQDHFISIAHQHSNACTYLAQAGVEYVMFLMKHNMMIFPSAPYSDNRQNNPSLDPNIKDYMQDEPTQVTNNNFYTWVGRKEMLGDGANGSLSDIAKWGKGSGTGFNANNYDDSGTSGVIDATEKYPAEHQKLPVDHYCIDNSTTYKPGAIINLFMEKDNDGNDVPIEFLLISRLTLSSDSNVGVELGSTNLCGSFKIRVGQPVDTPGGKYFFVKSTGSVKKVPESEMSKDPTLWEIQDETKFVTVSNKTIFARIPYFQSHFIVLPDNTKTNGYWPKYGTNLLDKEYVITPDQWYYKFR